MLSQPLSNQTCLSLCNPLHYVRIIRFEEHGVMGPLHARQSGAPECILSHVNICKRAMVTKQCSRYWSENRNQLPRRLQFLQWGNSPTSA
jgi:hypothetical protein